MSENEYEGTQNSKYGKVVVGVQPDAARAEIQVIDEGPQGKGFASTADAVSAINKLATSEWERKRADAVELDDEHEHKAMAGEDIELSTYHVLRVVKTIRPEPRVRVELDLGD